MGTENQPATNDPEDSTPPAATSHAHAPEVRGRKLALLCLTSLGIVYGDIGTSPLYAMRECFFGEYGVAVNERNVLGVLSLMFWCLVLVVTVKYLVFVMRADNNGEGGVIALMALLLRTDGKKPRSRLILVGCGLFGASLLYGDGMITPAISVLSAVEGLELATPFFKPYVVPITIAILVALFAVQSRGTAKVGTMFGPVTLVWLLVLSVLGFRGILLEPAVLRAVDPTRAFDFFLHNGSHGYLVLGAVFLVVTGTEALYADMGHFGARPIRLTWIVVVFPALLLNYFGQGALILSDSSTADHPFFALAPAWALIPLIVLATLATIIASQAVITGTFSLTSQAIQMDYCPRLRIDYTSAEAQGQIYVPAVNWLLMFATIALVLGFGSSGRLAAAYGVAVTTTMTITSILFYVVARERWGWSRLAAGQPTLVFLVIDLSFFGANIVKIAHGAWFPLAIGFVVFTVLATWRRGRQLLGEHFSQGAMPFAEFLEGIAASPPVRVPGRAVFMTSNASVVPPALLNNLKHNKVMHEETVVLSVRTENVPRVRAGEHVELEEIGEGLHRITAHYGFMQSASIPHILAAAKTKGLELTMAETVFFLGRESILANPNRGMADWRARLFGFLSRNAVGATDYFHIPSHRVIEFGEQVEM
ncbi:MAG: potassium transporter Kup [Planctomycetes bacterium]|nr:potassium transporter Kup [Planctomycetota bacterium]